MELTSTITQPSPLATPERPQTPKTSAQPTEAPITNRATRFASLNPQGLPTYHLRGSVNETC